MLVTLSGMVTEVRPMQPPKAELPMLVTPLPMVTEVRPVQPEKAESPMLVTLSGMLTEVRLEQPEKAPQPMLVTLSGMVTEVAHPLHFTTILLLIINPSLVSSSNRVAPQLSSLVKEELLTKDSVLK